MYFLELFKPVRIMVHECVHWQLEQANAATEYYSALLAADPAAGGLGLDVLRVVVPYGRTRARCLDIPYI